MDTSQPGITSGCILHNQEDHVTPLDKLRVIMQTVQGSPTTTPHKHCLLRATIVAHPVLYTSTNLCFASYLDNLDPERLGLLWTSILAHPV
ncbi:hypothetical protein H4Q26_018163 [Puccinia striiformis f. sp. tritici PST-130]|nr:hypothetical protein H4Q26_018163 [Puccinia striiformis f. sp. tritici PST-130]